MEDNLYKLNEIMKPYFEKKDYIEKLKNNIHVIKLRLERLFEAKQQAIQNYTNNNSYFYESMIKNDLNQTYKNEEQRLKEKLQELENLYNLEISSLIKIGIDIKNQLILEQDKIKNQLRKEEANYDSAINELENFKYEYNNQNQIINGEEWRNLYKRKLLNSTKIMGLNEVEQKTEDYLNLIEEQYQLIKNTTTLPNKNYHNEDSLNVIYNNIIKELEKLSEDSTDKKSIKLPCGEYLNEYDINNAIDNLYSRDKGKNYVVEETDKEYKISKETIDEIRQQLKITATHILVKNNKISQIDLFKVFGNEKAKEIVKEVERKNIDNSKFADGNYVLKNDVVKILDKAFNVKKENQVETLNNSKQDMTELTKGYRIK